MTDGTAPQPWFTTAQRFLRGYGPLGVLVVMVTLMALLIPSVVPERTGAITADDTDFGRVPDASAFVPADDDDDDEVAEGLPGDSEADGAPTTDAAAPGDVAPPPPGQEGDDAVAGVAGACADRHDQIPGDPYSPPCIAFSGDNGGATHRGVSGDSITVAFRVLNERGFQQTLATLAGAELVDTPTTVQNTVTALAEYFNERMQFYGRRIEIAFYNGTGSNTRELLGGGRQQAEADAITVADEIGAFADLSGTSEPYAGALARRGVIAFGTPYLSRQWHEERAPYAWSLATNGTLVSEFGAEYSLKRLYGKPADYAAGNLQGVDRKFGILAPENPWYQESVQNAQRMVREAGHDPGVNVQYVLNLGTMSDQAVRIVSRFKREGVTTILCGCDPILPVFLSAEAHKERYYPEFIVVGTALTDADIVGQLWHPAFAAQAFGVSPLNEFRPPTDTIAYAAYKTVRQDEPAFSVDLIYYQMYMLAIGLHMAGPNLTPHTFEQGMFNYPPRSGDLGQLSMSVGNRTFTDDVREIYWDPDAISTYNSERGAYIGTSPERWLPGQIPPGDPGKPRP